MHVFLLNIGCVRRRVTSSLSAHVMTTSETFYFKMADTITVCFNANIMKIKRMHIKTCKKHNILCV